MNLEALRDIVSRNGTYGLATVCRVADTLSSYDPSLKLAYQPKLRLFTILHSSSVSIQHLQILLAHPYRGWGPLMAADVAGNKFIRLIPLDERGHEYREISSAYREKLYCDIDLLTQCIQYRITGPTTKSFRALQWIPSERCQADQVKKAAGPLLKVPSDHSRPNSLLLDLWLEECTAILNIFCCCVSPN